MSNRKLVFVLLGIIIPTFILVIYLIFSIDNSIDKIILNVKDTVRYEIIKNALHLLVIVIVGGMVAYVFKSREETKKQENVQKEQEKEHHRREIRVEYFNRLGKIYRDVKSIRRALIAGGLTSRYCSPPSVITERQLDIYREQMNLLNANQLLLECLKIESKGIPTIALLEEVSTLLYQMENYIRQILKEYEKINAIASIHYSTLIKLDEFTYSTSKDFDFPPDFDKGYRFIECFSIPYKKIIEIIGNNLK